MIQAAEGCPKCGCAELARVSAVTDPFGRQLPVMECDHCGFHHVRFTEQLNDESTIITIKRSCPHCNSSNTRVYSTRPGNQVIRYHRCYECKLTFKSIELGRHGG